MKNASAFLFSIVFLPFSSQGHAESEPESMTVFATRTGDTILETPASVQILERKDLDRVEAPGSNLGTLLGKLVPGFGPPTESVSNFGQNLRGRDVLILIDGIPQIENRGVSRQLNSIKVESIERVEVISGANAIYGAGAPGGIINIITKGYRPEKVGWDSYLGTSFAANPLASSSEAYNLQQSVSGTLDTFSYLLSLGSEYRNNSFDANGNLIAPEPAQVSRSDTKSYDLLAKFDYRFSAGRSLELNLQAFEEQQDTDYVAVINPYRAETGLQLKEQPASKRRQALITYFDKDVFGQALTLQTYYRQRDLTFFPFALTVPVPLVNQSRTQSDAFGLKSVFQSDLTKLLNLAWGLDFEVEKGKQTAHSYNQLRYEVSDGKVFTGKSADYDYGPAIDTQKAALFAQFKAQHTTELTSKFGLRYETISQKVHDFTPPLETAISKNWPILYAGIAQMESAGRVPSGTTASLPTQYAIANFEGGKQSYDQWAFNYGVNYTFSPKQSVFFNYSQGYELADTARLLRDAVSPGSLIPRVSPAFKLAVGSSTVASLDLQAIRTSSYEMGWRGAIDRYYGNATLFYNESDKIYQFNRDFTVDLLNREKRVYGAEAELGWRTTDQLTMGISHSHNKGESRRAVGSGWTSLSAMDISPPKTSAHLEYLFSDAWSGSLRAQQIAAYNQADDVDIHEYLTVDAGMGYVFDTSSDMKVGVDNLLNRRYLTAFHQWAAATYGPASGAEAEGRRISVSYHKSF